MSETKISHTPGPWYVRPARRHVWDVRSSNDPAPSLYCTVEEGWGPSAGEVAEANARLIAAAPELLACLLELFDLAPSRRQEDLEKLGPAMDRAIAAIAKAKGRSVS